jgi:dihydrofolate reductase
MTITFQAIVATDNNGAIGYQNTIPWRAPVDMKRFKRITSGCPIIMGYNTALSLGRALPGRLNIVLSRKRRPAPFEGMVVVDTVARARELAIAHIQSDEKCWDREEVFIIGGGEIYRAFLPFYDGLHLTTVDTVIPHADAFFPVEKFLERYAKTKQLRLQQGSATAVRDGEYKTTYAYYGIVTSYDATRADLANTQDHLPWNRQVTPNPGIECVVPQNEGDA